MKGRQALLWLFAGSIVIAAAAIASPTAAQPAASPPAPMQPASPQTATGQTFATAEEAASALVEAARSGKPDAVEKILGPGSAGLVSSGDPVSDAGERQRFLTAYDDAHKLVAAEPDKMILQVGKDDWPLPIPLVQADGRWHFDTQAGAQELVDRRIGRNELNAIRTALVYADAQKEFFDLTAETGPGEYAQRLVASPGKYDGLYWPSADGVPDSPLAPLVAQAVEEGYPGERVGNKPMPYHGYFFRILTGQGTSTPDGARSYIEAGRMTKGFGLIAWPATYGASGIISFIVNQDGIVYQKDLGPNTTAAAAAIKLFDPDLSWKRIDVVN